jgi:hypothetical protein
MKLKMFAGLAAILLITLFSACEIPLVPEGERVFRVTVTVTGTVTTDPTLVIEFYGDTAFTEPDGVTAWVPHPFAPVTLPDSRSYTALVDYTDPTRSLYFDLTYELATGEEIAALIEYEELVPDGWSGPQVLFTKSVVNTSGAIEFGEITKSVLLPPP